MTQDFLGGALLGFLAGFGLRYGWRPLDDPQGRAEAVARIRIEERMRECPAPDEALVARIRRGK